MAIEKLNLDWKNKGESGYENSKINKAKMKKITDKIDEIIENVENRGTITQDVIIKSGYSLNDERRYFVIRNNSFDLDLMITVTDISNSFPTTLTTIATISSANAPLRDLFFPIFADNNNGSEFQTAICRITKEGNIDVAALNQNVKRVNVRQGWMK